MQLSALRSELPEGALCLCSSRHGSLLSCFWQPFQVLTVSDAMSWHPILRHFPLLLYFLEALEISWKCFAALLRALHVPVFSSSVLSKLVFLVEHQSLT